MGRSEKKQVLAPNLPNLSYTSSCVRKEPKFQQLSFCEKLVVDIRNILPKSNNFNAMQCYQITSHVYFNVWATETLIEEGIKTEINHVLDYYSDILYSENTVVNMTDQKKGIVHQDQWQTV